MIDVRVLDSRSFLPKIYIGYISNSMSTKKFNICCIGAGNVGGSTMPVIAKYCEQTTVTVCDINQKQIDAWNSKKSIPIYEPGLFDIVQDRIGKNLFFTTDVDTSIKEADIIFVTVNTPTKQKGMGKGEAADLTFWELAARRISEVCNKNNLSDLKIVVEKSTVPVKTADAMLAIAKNLRVRRHLKYFPIPSFSRKGPQ